MHHHRLYAFLFPLLISAGITGTVVGVHDGDTLRLRTETATIKVRLFGIDAPELGQPFSRASREKLSGLTFGRPVQLVIHGKDAYGRHLAEVLLEDGTNVNHEMVRAGMAYYFRKYTRSKALENMEDEARRERRGVWSVDGMVPPWEYRKKGRTR
jgi:endonuclease YncB( thermonuclease family)